MCSTVKTSKEKSYLTPPWSASWDSLCWSLFWVDLNAWARLSDPDARPLLGPVLVSWTPTTNITANMQKPKIKIKCTSLCMYRQSSVKTPSQKLQLIAKETEQGVTITLYKINKLVDFWLSNINVNVNEMLNWLMIGPGMACYMVIRLCD